MERPAFRMADLLCFGELMLRLSTPDHLRIAQAQELIVNFGGAEANVAVTVAQLGGSAGFITKLPNNELAERALAELRGLRVEVDRVVRGGSRMGVYFVEHGASVRSSGVLYDRAHSAIAEAPPEDFDWETILAGARWLHWSGITAALSPNAARACEDACRVAKRIGATVSFDVNFRAKLWSQQEAGRVLSPLMKYVNLCVTSAEEARAILQLKVPETASEEEVARVISDRFGCREVALTQRRSGSANQTEWGAMLLSEGRVHTSSRYQVEIVDRLGAGDSFTGGLIFGLMRGDEAGRALELAVAASALKHTVYGDYNLVTLPEVEALMQGGSGGRVRR